MKFIQILKLKIKKHPSKKKLLNFFVLTLFCATTNIIFSSASMPELPCLFDPVTLPTEIIDTILVKDKTLPDMRQSIHMLNNLYFVCKSFNIYAQKTRLALFSKACTIFYYPKKLAKKVGYLGFLNRTQDLELAIRFAQEETVIKELKKTVDPTYACLDGKTVLELLTHPELHASVQNLVDQAPLFAKNRLHITIQKPYFCAGISATITSWMWL